MIKINSRWVCVLCLLGVATVARGADSPAMEYLQRLNRIDRDDAAAVSTLADWAHERGLAAQAAELYRRVVTLKPEDERAYNRLVKISDTTRIPEDQDRQKRLVEGFGDEFSLHVAPHFLVVYDTEPAWAINRAVLLEKTHDFYYSSLRGAGLRPLPLGDRLVCVLFSEHDDFAAYAKAVDGMEMAWSSGYYSPRSNRTVFYNDRSNPAFNEAVRQMAALEQQVLDLGGKLRNAARQNNPALVSAHRRAYNQARRELSWYRNRRDALAGLANAAKTIHEAVHQLSFNSNLQTRGVMYPFWLSEGLATNFETTDPTQAFGPYHPNPARQQALIKANQNDQLMSLDEFVVLIHPPTDDAARAAVLYAQGWGLFHFLFTRRHEQMRGYLKSLADAPPGPRDADALREEFEEAFGPLGSVEDDWNRHLRLLQ